MAKNGHWYTDEQGNHYFVEEGQSPKEGWEASKRRKMISGGKYKVSEDGNDYRDVDMDEYSKYEADEDEFDATNDDDFGFDEEGDIEYNREMQKAQEQNADMSEGEDGSELLTDNDMNQIKKYAERYEVPLDGLKQVIEEETQKLIDNGASVTNAKNDAMESVLDEVVSRGNLESFLKNGAKSENTEETYSDDDLGYRKNDKGGFDILVKETEDRDEKLLKSVNSRDEARQYIRSLLGKDKNISDYKEFSSDSEARKYFDEHANELPDGSALYGNKIYLGEENKPANVDALYRPDEDKGPRESKGPADPNAPAGQEPYGRSEDMVIDNLKKLGISDEEISRMSRQDIDVAADFFRRFNKIKPKSKGPHRMADVALKEDN